METIRVAFPMATMEKGDVANEKEPNMFDRAGSAVSKFFVRSFEKLGLFCGTRPWTTIGLALLFVIICGAVCDDPRGREVGGGRPTAPPGGAPPAPG